MSSSHNRPTASVIGGASHQTEGEKTRVSGPGLEEGAYKPSTGRDKSIVDHANKVLNEAKHQVDGFFTTVENKLGEHKVGGNQLFDKADGSEKEGAAMDGMLNKYVDETAPSESSS